MSSCRKFHILRSHFFYFIRFDSEISKTPRFREIIIYRSLSIVTLRYSIFLQFSSFIEPIQSPVPRFPDVPAEISSRMEERLRETAGNNDEFRETVDDKSLISRARCPYRRPPLFTGPAASGPPRCSGPIVSRNQQPRYRAINAPA